MAELKRIYPKQEKESKSKQGTTTSAPTNVAVVKTALNPQVKKHAVQAEIASMEKPISAKKSRFKRFKHKKAQFVSQSRRYWSLNNPSRLITTSFLLTILLGSILLKLPIASANGISLPYLTCLFTATSATCVTGLVLVDTMLSWSLFGKVVILAMIQIGGLSLLTILAALGIGISRQVNLTLSRALRNTTAGLDYSESFKLVKQIILLTLSCEGIGALFFTWRFAYYMPLPVAFGKAIFHSVSAFCNAGFDLMGDLTGPLSSLTHFNNDLWIIIGTAVLIISGGLGFVVWVDLLHFPKHRILRFHSRLVLKMTLILIVFGSIAFWLLESQNNVAGGLLGLSAGERPVAAFFQSVTLRTAGFNSIDQASLTDGSKALGIFLMLVGAGPASTAGGIKVTTLAIILAAVRADFFCKGGEVRLIKYRISSELIRRALSITMLGMSLTWALAMLMAITLPHNAQTANIHFIDMLYEAASAFGTVGVSSATTSSFSHIAHIGIIITIFIGRVGPASMLLSFVSRKHEPATHVYPEGKTYVG